MSSLAKAAEASLRADAGNVVGQNDLNGFSILRTCKESCFVMKRNEKSLIFAT